MKQVFIEVIVHPGYARRNGLRFPFGADEGEGIVLRQ
jgi:hypothetical protein